MTAKYDERDISAFKRDRVFTNFMYIGNVYIGASDGFQKDQVHKT